MSNFEMLLADNPIVGAIRNDDDLNLICKSTIKIVFVLYGSILSIKKINEILKANGKIVFIHLDMLEGIKADQKGVEFIKETIDPYGIISTKGVTLKHASNLGMFTIQRIFMLDTLSFETGIKSVHTISPDAVEVLPGIATKAIETLGGKINQPVIAGGLIKTKRDAINALSVGAKAISTSCTELWEFEEMSR
jgi:glycerol uptake operon antiterminator